MAFSPVIKSYATAAGAAAACVPHNSFLSMKRLKERTLALSPTISGKGRKIFVLGSDCGEISQFPLRPLALCTTPQELAKVGTF